MPALKVGLQVTGTTMKKFIVVAIAVMRSAKATGFLRSIGFKNVRNLAGGILGWIDQVDPTQPKY